MTRTAKFVGRRSSDFSARHGTDPTSPSGAGNYLFTLMVRPAPGGIQEETTYLGVPCLTLRENTERPITVWEGTNVMIGGDFDLLQKEIAKVVSGNAKTGKIPEKWEGKAGERTALVLEDLLL